MKLLQGKKTYLIILAAAAVYVADLGAHDFDWTYTKETYLAPLGILAGATTKMAINRIERLLKGKLS